MNSAFQRGCELRLNQSPDPTGRAVEVWFEFYLIASPLIPCYLQFVVSQSKMRANFAAKEARRLHNSPAHKLFDAMSEQALMAA